MLSQQDTIKVARVMASLVQLPIIVDGKQFRSSGKVELPLPCGTAQIPIKLEKIIFPADQTLSYYTVGNSLGLLITYNHPMNTLSMYVVDRSKVTLGNLPAEVHDFMTPKSSIISVYARIKGAVVVAFASVNKKWIRVSL